ncbi:MAG: hypothetical protein HKN13_05345 [Rhodothermales bacterium]|nr:hypothetical protein [Rhodothermales bacterium]
MPGLIIGGIYVLLVFGTVRLAQKRSRKSFMLIVLGGMSLRLFLAIASIALIFALVPINKQVFLAAFFAVFLIGLVLETVMMHRHGTSSDDNCE